MSVKFFIMKKIFLLLSIILLPFAMLAGQLVLINVNSAEELNKIFNKDEITVHYYCDNFVIATADEVVAGMQVLDENAFLNTNEYCIVYCPKDKQTDYLVDLQGDILYSMDNYLIVVPQKGFVPAVNDGTVAIFNKRAQLSKQERDFPTITEVDEKILGYIDEMFIDSIMATVQTLQDIGSRYCASAGATEAQEWIQSKFEAMDLDVTIRPVPVIYGYIECSSNVIAVQEGSVYPDEYIVCGCHYDSFTYEAMSGGLAPGADDNATGVAGILEVARVLSQYEFDRSIIYCTFSGEELGLHGSGEFASYCASVSADILGYFNIDMSGYLLAGDDIHIDMIYPNSAEPLANYYMNFCNVYYPDMAVEHKYFSSGDSDHTSFNNNGYMGIFPFEDVDNYSPYIHTTNDLIGPSVNNFEQCKRFAEATLGCIAVLAAPTAPVLFNPINLTAVFSGNKTLYVSWENYNTYLVDFILYRDDVAIDTLPNNVLEYLDVMPDFDEHCYKATAYYEGYESAFSNESCASVSNVSINEQVDNAIALYPNPTDGKITISGNDVINHIIIYDINGHKCIQLSNIQPNSNIDVSNLPAGSYTVAVETNRTKNTIKLIVK